MERPVFRGYIPLGSIAVAQSIRAGSYLEFFNPAPMETWASRLVPSDDSTLGLSALQSRILSQLVYGAILRERLGVQTERIPLLLDCALNGQSGAICVDGFKKIASVALGISSLQLRNQMIYSSEISVAGNDLYAQEDEVEPLARSLFQHLTDTSSDHRGLNFLCCVLLQLLLIHPFLDGNGRTARHFAIYLSAGRNLLGTAALVIALQWWNRGWFNELAFKARAAGLDYYLEGYNEAFRLAAEKLKKSSIYKSIVRIPEASHGRQEYEDGIVIDHLMAHGETDVDAIRRILSCSMSKAEGVAKRITTKFEVVTIVGSRLTINEAADGVRAVFLT